MDNKLRKLIRELVEEELEELSTAANAGEYQSKYAFGGGKHANEKTKSIANQAGYTLMNKLDAADKDGNQEHETLPFGEKSAGALKKPKESKVISMSELLKFEK